MEDPPVAHAALCRTQDAGAQLETLPISVSDWRELKKSALCSEEDVVYLRLSLDVLEDQIDDLLKTWRVIIFDHPHLRAYDEDPNIGQVDSADAKAVGKRFGRSVIDTARAHYAPARLDYQIA